MLKKQIYEYYIANKNDCLMVILLLTFGIVLGIVVMLFVPDSTSASITEGVRNTFKQVTDNNSQPKGVILNGIKTNLSLIGIMALLTITLIGKYGIYFLTALKGMSVGIYFVILVKIFGAGYGALAILLSAIVQIVYIPAYIYLAVAFISFNFELFKTRRDSMTSLIICKVLAKTIVAFIVMCSSVAIEQMLTPLILEMYTKI